MQMHFQSRFFVIQICVQFERGSVAGCHLAIQLPNDLLTYLFVNSLFLYIFFFIVFCNDCYYLASVCISICTGKRNLLNDETSFSYSIAYETFPFVVNCGSRIKYVHFRQMRFHDSAIRQQFKKFTFSQIFQFCKIHFPEPSESSVNF